jgi:hypothetical protein
MAKPETTSRHRRVTKGTPRTEGEIAQLMACWKRGMSAGEIEDEIPTKSRSAILGKLKRLRENQSVTDKPAARKHA